MSFYGGCSWLWLVLLLVGARAESTIPADDSWGKGLGERVATTDLVRTSATASLPKTPPQPSEEAVRARDPFWPVGYVPGKQDTNKPPSNEVKPVQVAPPRWQEATRSLKIKGVLRVSEGKYVAMINDRIVGAGDTMEAIFAGRRYRWKVKSVTREGVKFLPLESEVLGGR